MWGDRPRDTPLSDFGAQLTITSPNGVSATFTLTQEAEKLPTDTAEMFYTNVLLRAPGEQELSTEDLAWFEKGFEPPADQQSTSAGGAALNLALSGTISFADPRAQPIALTVAFEKGPRRVVMQEASDEVVPSTRTVRVHYATATGSSSIDGIYRIVRWTVTGGAPELMQTYNAGYLYPFGRSCESNSICSLDVYTMPRNSNEPDRRRALICGPETGDTTNVLCRGLADSKPYEPSGGLLKPIANDNFFTLAGPVLTGSDDVGSHGNPGEPAVINHWNEIRAEFKGDKVTGTITTSQLIQEVVNGKVVSTRRVDLTVEFEE